MTGQPKSLELAVELLVRGVHQVSRPEHRSGISINVIAYGFVLGANGERVVYSQGRVCHAFMGNRYSYQGEKTTHEVAAVWSTWCGETKADHLEWCKFVVSDKSPWRKLFPKNLNVVIGGHHIYSPEFMHEYGFIFTDLKYASRYYMNFFIASRLFYEWAIRDGAFDLYKALADAGVNKALSHYLAGIYLLNKSNGVIKPRAVGGGHWPFNSSDEQYVKRILNGDWVIHEMEQQPYREKLSYNFVNTIWGEISHPSYHEHLGRKYQDLHTCVETPSISGDVRKSYTLNIDQLIEIAKAEEQCLIN